MATPRNLRACLLCSIVQTSSAFLRTGCPNCETYLQLQNSPDQVADCTSQIFDSLVTLGSPQDSWVAKWQRLTSYVPGVYAVKVVGQLPESVVGLLEDNGIKYLPRDGSAGDERDREDRE